MMIRKPYVMVQVSYEDEKQVWFGAGFAKWNMLDKKIVDKAEKLLKRVDPECCEFCEAMADFCVRIIEKFKWSEERGVVIAKGRAVKDVVKQIMEKSSVGQIDFDLSMKMSSPVGDIASMIHYATVDELERLAKIKEAKVENG